MTDPAYDETLGADDETVELGDPATAETLRMPEPGTVKPGDETAVLDDQAAPKEASGGWVKRAHAGLAAHEDERETEGGRAGRTLAGDRFKVIRELGRGGMGVVLEVEDTVLRRRVALKMITAGDLASPAQLERFRIEGRAAARLRHPNVVSVLEVGERRGEPFLVMDLVVGEALDDRLEREGPLPSREAARITRPLAEALAYAHTRSILHRDLKPANVLLAKDGQPLLTDFGLAKDLEDKGAGPTASGQIMGTPAFMPPEQARGDMQAVDRRSDVYSLGATLYCMLTGEPPFDGKTIGQVLYAVNHDDPIPPRRLRADVERDLETICLKCLEKEPAQRYGTAGELADDLGRYLEDRPIEATPPTAVDRLRKWQRRNQGLVRSGLVFGLIALVAGGASTATFVQRIQDERDRADRERTDAIANKTLAEEKTEEASRQRALAEERLLEAQRLLGHALDEKGRSAIERKAWPEAAIFLASAFERGALPERLAPTLHALSNAWGFTAEYPHPDRPDRLSWSPTADRLVSLSSGEARLWSAGGIETLAGVTAAAWSPNGSLATGGREATSITLRSPAGEQIATLVGDQHVMDLAYSPSGETLAATNLFEVTLWDVAALTSTTVLRTSTSDRVESIDWSPDGSLVLGWGRSSRTASVWAISSGEQSTLVLEGEVLKAAFSPTRSLLAVATIDTRARRTTTPARRPGEPVRFDDGQANARSSVTVWNAVSKKKLTTITFAGEVSAMTWSPDGFRIAAASLDDRLRIVNLNTRKVTLEIEHDFYVAALAWTPDGARLVAGTGQGAVCMWDATSGEPTAILERSGDADASVWSLAWSKDGSRLACAGDDSVRVFRAAYPVTLTGPEPDARLPTTATAWSPDGARFAAGLITEKMNVEAGVYDERVGVFVWDAASGRVELALTGHTDLVKTLAWSHDGSLLASAAWDQTVKVWDARSGALLHSVKGLHGSTGFKLAWAPSERILASSGDEDESVRLWNASTGSSERLELAGHLNALAWQPGGMLLATGAQTLRLWNGLTGAQIASPAGHTEAIQAVHWSPDGALLASGSRDKSVRVWDSAGAPIAVLSAHEDTVYRFAWSPDGARLASEADGVVTVWNPRSAERVHTLKRHKGTVYGLAWSHDGTRLATSSLDRLILWSADGQVVHEDETLNSLADATWVTPAVLGAPHPGGVLAIPKPGHGAIFLRGDAGQLLGELPSDADSAELLTARQRKSQEASRSQAFGLSLTISPDGSRLAVVDDTARLWDLRAALASPAALRVQAEERTGKRLEGLNAVSTGPTSVCLVTYNVWFGEPQRDARVKAILALLRESDADVIALQEVKPWFSSALLKEEWIAEYSYPRDETGQPWVQGDVFLLSKTPLESVTYVPLESRMGRQALIARTRIAGVPLVIGNCHLDSFLEDGPLRARQLDVILAALGPGDALLLGDFNFGPGATPEAAHLDAAFVDLWASDDPGFTWDVKKNPFAAKGSFPGEGSRRLDRILVRSSKARPVSVKLIGTQPIAPGVLPSDHFGVRGTIELSR